RPIAQKAPDQKHRAPEAPARSATPRRDAAPARVLSPRACGNSQSPPAAAARGFASPAFLRPVSESAPQPKPRPQATPPAEPDPPRHPPPRQQPPEIRPRQNPCLCVVCVPPKKSAPLLLFRKKLRHERHRGNHPLVVHAHRRQDSQRSLHLILR